MDSAQALFQMLAWQVTNSRGYASSPTSRVQSRPFHVNSAATSSELIHESELATCCGKSIAIATIFDAFPKMLSPLV